MNLKSSFFYHHYNLFWLILKNDRPNATITISVLPWILSCFLLSVFVAMCNRRHGETLNYLQNEDLMYEGLTRLLSILVKHLISCPPPICPSSPS